MYSELLGLWKIDVPHDINAAQHTITGMEECSSSVLTAKRPHTYTPRPTAVGPSQPTRSETVPESGPIKAFTIGSAKKSNPEMSEPKPWAS